jgi:HPt (histidine-containing phosphotransfer) domain-containing protein
MNKYTYTHIDLSYLYEIAEDDKDFITDMISDYIQKVPLQFAELQQAAEEQNFEQTHFIAHKIKSSFQFMGAKQLVELASNIEKVSRTPDTQLIKTDLATMKPVVELVLAELKHQLSIL